MTILVGKLPRRTYISPNGEFNLYHLRISGGQFKSAVYVGIDPPKALKTVDYQLNGEWYVGPKGDQQFRIHSYRRIEKHTPEERAELAILLEAQKRI